MPMLDEFFVREIRRTNRNGMLVGLFFLAITLVPAWHYRAYILSVVRGPAAAGEAELAPRANPNPLLESFVKVHGGEVASTGARVVARDSGKNEPDRVVANVVALKLGEHYLLAKVPVTGGGPEQSGELVDMPQELRQIVVTEHLAKHPEIAQMVYPYLLDATKSRFGDPWMLLVGIFFFLLGALCLGKAIRHMAVPESAPVMKALSRYGEPGGVSMQIAQELRIAGDREKFGSARLTAAWLVEATSWKTTIMRMADIVWAYPKVIKHSYNFIPTGKTYHVVVRDRAGQSLEIQVKKDQSPVMLQALSRRTPWALYGFDKQIESAWTKNRAELIRAVDQRNSAQNQETKQATVEERAGALG
jgi:hypothetical protein